MLSKELKDFLEMTLEDGIITDKERSLLYEKAAKEGISINEMDTIIDAELTKHIKSQANTSPVALYRNQIEEINQRYRDTVRMIQAESSQELNRINDKSVLSFRGSQRKSLEALRVKRLAEAQQTKQNEKKELYRTFVIEGTVNQIAELLSCTSAEVSLMITDPSSADSDDSGLVKGVEETLRFVMKIYHTLCSRTNEISVLDGAGYDITGIVNALKNGNYNTDLIKQIKKERFYKEYLKRQREKNFFYKLLKAIFGKK